MWVAAVYKQHNSLVVTLPKELARRLKVGRGDHVVFEVVKNMEGARVTNLVTRSTKANGK